MNFVRALPALCALFAVGAAIAHPGHEAPPIHAHDWHEFAVLAAIIVAVAVVGVAVLAAWKARRKER